MSTQTTGIEVVGTIRAQYDEILTPEALNFIEKLERNFGARRIELLQFGKNAKRKSIAESFQISSLKQSIFVMGTGQLLHCRRTFRIVVSRLLDRQIEKWSLML